MKISFDKQALIDALTPAAADLRAYRQIGLQFFSRKSADSYPAVNRWDAVKANVALIDVVREYENAKQSGNRYVVLCPFHDEDTPSCYIYEDHYHCFGCGAHGSVIDYYAHKRGIEPQTAVDELVQRYLPLLDTDPKARRNYQQSIIKRNTGHDRQKSERERLVDLIDKKAEDLADTSPEDRDKLVAIMQLPDEEQHVDVLVDICTKYGIDVPPAELPNLRHPDEPEETEVKKPDVRSLRSAAAHLSDAVDEERKYIWDRILPRGEYTILAGSSGNGKGLLSCLIAASVVQLNPLPTADDSDKKNVDAGRGIFWYITSEDDLTDIHKRLKATGFHDEIETYNQRLHIWSRDKLFPKDGKEISFDLDSIIQMVDDEPTETKPDVLLIDPLQQFLPEGTRLIDAISCRKVMGRLSACAGRNDVSVIVTCHKSKGTQSETNNTILGSSDIVNAARSVLQCTKIGNGQFVAIHTKSSYTTLAPSWKYEMTGEHLHFAGVSDLNADDLDASTRNRQSLADIAVIKKERKQSDEELYTAISEIIRESQESEKVDIPCATLKEYCDGQVKRAIERLRSRFLDEGIEISELNPRPWNITDEDGETRKHQDRGYRFIRAGKKPTKRA